MPAVHRSRRRAAALLTVLLLACGALLAPAGALAAESLEPNSFNELSEKASQETTPTETTSTTKTEESESHNSSKTILIAGGAAVVLIAVIGFVIVRDARRVAPAGAEELSEGNRGRDPAVRHRNRRAKSKAARQQRKKNR
jgi:ABC-type Fe3+ transport system permease subunit